MIQRVQTLVVVSIHVKYLVYLNVHAGESRLTAEQFSFVSSQLNPQDVIKVLYVVCAVVLYGVSSNRGHIKTGYFANYASYEEKPFVLYLFI